MYLGLNGWIVIRQLIYEFIFDNFDWIIDIQGFLMERKAASSLTAKVFIDPSKKNIVIRKNT